MYLKAKEFKALLDNTPGLTDMLESGSFKVTYLADGLCVTIEEARKIISQLIRLNAIKSGPHGYKLYGDAEYYFKTTKQKMLVDSQRTMWSTLFKRMTKCDASYSKQLINLCDTFGMDRLIKFFVENPKFKASKFKTYLNIGSTSNPEFGTFNFEVMMPLLESGILVQLSMFVEPKEEDMFKPTDINSIMSVEYGVNPDLFDAENSIYGTIDTQK